MSKDEQVIYCIDTSAFIDLRVLYPMDTFPSLWDELDKLISSGRLISPAEVYDEIKKRDTELLDWVKQRKSMFVKLDEAQDNEVKKVLAEFPDLSNAEKETPDADPFVVALALVRNNQSGQSLFLEKCIVVQHERYNLTGKKKIPNVCRHYNIENIRIEQLFKLENWKF